MTSPTKNEELISEINAKLKQAYNADEEFWRQRSRTSGQHWATRILETAEQNPLTAENNSGDSGVEPT